MFAGGRVEGPAAVSRGARSRAVRKRTPGESCDRHDTKTDARRRGRAEVRASGARARRGVRLPRCPTIGRNFPSSTYRDMAAIDGLVRRRVQASTVDRDNDNPTSTASRRLLRHRRSLHRSVQAGVRDDRWNRGRSVVTTSVGRQLALRSRWYVERVEGASPSGATGRAADGELHRRTRRQALSHDGRRPRDRTICNHTNSTVTQLESWCRRRCSTTRAMHESYERRGGTTRTRCQHPQDRRPHARHP